MRNLQPILNDGVYGFALLPLGAKLDGIDLVASLREPEGVTVVAREEILRAHGIPPVYRAAWITLSADTELEEVGITAAFSAALAAAYISCNVFAGVKHDHLFVPIERASDALAVLDALA